MSSKSPKLVEGPVEKTLLDLTIPMVLGIISIQLFTVVDTFYIGLLGTEKLAAVSFTFPVVMIVMSFNRGLGAGVSALIARAIGEGKHQRVRRLSTDSLILTFILIMSIGILGWLTIDPVFLLLGASESMLGYIHDYMDVWYLGVVCLVIPSVGLRIIRSTGDSKSPSYIVMVAGIVNAVLDPFLIFGIGPFPRMELAGAAIATVISYASALLPMLWLLAVRERMLDYSLPKISVMLQSWKQILTIGIPSIAADMMLPISNGILTRIISVYGPLAVAAFGVGTRVESLALMGTTGMVAAIAPFVGQNWGAQRMDRVKQGLRYSFRFSLVSGGAICLFLGVLAYPIARIFSDDPAAHPLIAQYFWLIPASYGMYGIMQIGNTVYNALHMPLHATSLVMIRLFAFTVPLAYLGAWIYDLPGIFIGLSASNLLIGLVAYLMLKQSIPKVEQNQQKAA